MAHPPKSVGYPTIDDLLDAMSSVADARPDDVAIRQMRSAQRKVLGVSGATEITYRALRDRVHAAAHRLREFGMKPGDGVIFAVLPSIEAVVLLCAAILAGGNVLGVDLGVGRQLLKKRLALVNPRWMMAHSIVYCASSDGILRWVSGLAGLSLPDLGKLDANFVRVGSWLPGVPQAIQYTELTRPLEEPARIPRAGGRPCFVLFTSGTTAMPKVVQHTASSLGATCSIIEKLMALRPGDVVYSRAGHQILSALLAGASVVMPGRSQSPAQFLREVTKHRITHTYAGPYEMERVLELLEKTGTKLPDHLRSIILGSAPIHRVFLDRLRKVCSDETDIWCVYAMSEMLPVTLVESREKLAYNGLGDLVGRPVPGASVELTEDQELLVAGPNLFRGYVGQDPVSVHASGDYARIDEQGRVILLGRKKDMIIRGSFNIYPALYEEAIGAIEGVKACAMIGVDNANQTDEIVVLAVESVNPYQADVVVRRVRQAIVDGSCDIDVQSHPDHVVAVQLPYAGRTMKLDRVSLRKQLAEMIGVTPSA